MRMLFFFYSHIFTPRTATAKRTSVILLQTAAVAFVPDLPHLLGTAVP